MNPNTKSHHRLAEPSLTVTAEGVKELERQVTNFLMTLNRHERRAWCARLSRKAGKARDKALCAVISNKKLLRRAKKAAKN